MGTPEFAVATLELLLKNHYNIVAIVSTPDKNAGRGLKLQSSPVKEVGLKNNIPVLQPEKLKSEEFIDTLKKLTPDLFIVVAFRMLPKQVWTIPPMGTINLHASLLPDYRGAAPINHAIINGETRTGLTTFFIDEQIDTGKIILQETIAIGAEETAGALHDRMKDAGAQLIIKTIEALGQGYNSFINQNNLQIENRQLKQASKISKEFCRINWQKSTKDIYNHIRGLSPYPAAFTELVSPSGEKFFIKIYKAKIANALQNHPVFSCYVHEKQLLRVCLPDGYIEIEEIQLSGKRKMPTSEFLKGFPMEGKWSVEPV